MYQALYRKWRPRVFDDVAGQPHVTETLRRQVETGRLSHAYLFTGSRGTGKTTAAKILARAVNCEQPDRGNPCNRCNACIGIENGSILDVLEMDAASNNGVDHVRALRDEAIYSPAAVRRRVYIVDEVHMLSTAAFNALLKILEEPPEHLMFILATTELHKVPATILSRCQRFSFQRILPEVIAARLSHVAQAEGIDLTEGGAALLARLADGALRDALSCLDQCMGGGGVVDETRILDALGLAGGADILRLTEAVAEGDGGEALSILSELYACGRDISAVLSELAGMVRDLLVSDYAPKGGLPALGGWTDPGALRELRKRFSHARLVAALTLLQTTQAGLIYSANRRLDAEICLLRLCDVTLDDGTAGLLARLERLERMMERGVEPGTPLSGGGQAAASDAPKENPPAVTPKETVPPAVKKTKKTKPPVLETADGGEPMAEPPPPETARPEPAGAGPTGPDFWDALLRALDGQIDMGSYLELRGSGITGWEKTDGRLTLFTKDAFVQGLLSRPSVKTVMEREAEKLAGQPVILRLIEHAPAPQEEKDRFQNLLALGEKFDIIQ